MNIYDIEVEKINGEKIKLDEFKDKVLLVVNTASKCGFTHQYDGLQRLYEKYSERGFEVLAFPSNQFAFQEPGDNQEILSFCQVNFGISFPIFSKIKVNGPKESPLYTYLKEQLPGRITWNFNKFLINKNGEVVSRFGSKVEPKDLEKEIESLL